MRSAPLVAGLLLLCALDANAQMREQVTIEVVDVPVYVYSKGQPVRNLTKDDFELYVNGRRQAIEYFDRIDFAAAPAVQGAAASTSAPPVRDLRDRRLFLLLFDLAYTRPGGVERSRRAALSMVEHASPEDFFAVATYASTGTNFVIPFTRDRAVIDRALASLSRSRARDALSLSITTDERAYAESLARPEAAQSSPGRSFMNEDPVTDLMSLAADQQTQRAQNLAKSQLEDLETIAARLTHLDGYKHVVFFSNGFGALLWNSLGTPHPDPSMTAALAALAKSFGRAGALLHTIDLRPVVVSRIDPGLQTAPGTSHSGRATDAISGAVPAQSAFLGDPINETLFRYANETGGEFVHWRNDIGGALGDLSNTLSAGYRLGFRPLNARKGENEIAVKVKKVPALTRVSYRKGFSTTHESTNAADALLLADIIQNDTPQSGTPPVLSFPERPFLVVTVPARQLAKEFGAIPDADVLLYVFDEKGAAVDYRERKFAISAEPAADIGFREKLQLPPGRYVAKSLLRVGSSLGFAKVEFTLPETGGN